jgi:hypothetical protein
MDLLSSSCLSCGPEAGVWSGALEDRFDMPDEYLSWNDGPLAGIVVCKACRQVYAFRCKHCIWNTLIHWELIAISHPKSGDAEDAYIIEARSAASWLSVLDDQRPGQSRCVPVWIRQSGMKLDW